MRSRRLGAKEGGRARWRFPWPAYARRRLKPRQLAGETRTTEPSQAAHILCSESAGSLALISPCEVRSGADGGMAAAREERRRRFQTQLVNYETPRCR